MSLLAILLVASAQDAVVPVRSDPPGARVTIRGAEGEWKTPCKVPAAAGAEILIEKEGYETIVRKVGTGTIEVDLSPRTGSIIVEGCPPGASAVLLKVKGDVADAETAIRKWTDATQRESGITLLARAVADDEGRARLERVPVTEEGWLRVANVVRSGIRSDWKSPVTVSLKPAPAAGRRIRITSPGGAVRVTAGGKVVAEIEVKPGEPVEIRVPLGALKIEHLEALGKPATHVVELLPKGTPVAAPVAEGTRVGTVRLVHHVYGVFLRLDAGAGPATGEEVTIWRDGSQVARARIVKLCPGDETYPDGAAQLAGGVRGIKKGDEARRIK